MKTRKSARTARDLPERSRVRPPAVPTLDDLASLLVQAEPDDRASLEKLKASFSILLTETELDEFARDFLERAAAEIDALLAGKAEKPADTLIGASRLVEAAQRIIEMNSPAEADDAPPSASRPASNPPPRDDGGDVMPEDIDPEMLSEFISESRDNIHAAEASLLALETNPEDLEAINTVFRAFHTIKGMSAFLRFRGMTELAHHSESLFCRIRSNDLKYGFEAADLALRSVDLLKAYVQSVENAMGGEPFLRLEGLDAQIRALNCYEDGLSPIAEERASGALSTRRLGEILVEQGSAEMDEVEAAVASRGDEPVGVALVRANMASVEDVAHALRGQQKARGTDAVESSVRVRTDRLDRLMNLVGELVIAQSMLDQDDFVTVGSNHELERKVNHSGKVVRELQDLCMAVRMVPLKATFQKMARLVRDLARQKGKMVAFVAEGEETEIDRTLVEVVGEFLVHMVRNSLDHGVGTPEERTRAGKTPNGTLRLAARHEGGGLLFELEDDGKGLDRDRIAAKAVEQGIIPRADGMSDGEIYNLIFAPGFSTAETVTDLSGRGVGMDVVRQGVERLRGTIEINSRPGLGCRFIMRVPLTMAITEGMVIRVGAQRFIIPTMKIRLSLRPTADQLSTVSGRGEMLRFMDEMIPVHRLHQLFEITPRSAALEDGLLIVVDEGLQRFALFVDDLLGQVQVVAKTLGEGIGRVPGVSAGAILGDGKVGLILDTSGLAAMTKVGMKSGGEEGNTMFSPLPPIK